MESYSLSVCLTDLQGAMVQAKQNGKRFILIPIDDAGLFMSDKGKVYLNLNLWANKSGQPDQYGKTHSVKQNLSKEKSEALKASGAKIPFIGGGKPIVMKNQNGQQLPPMSQPVYQQQPPAGYQQTSYPQAQSGFGQPYSHNPSDDIPF